MSDNRHNIEECPLQRTISKCEKKPNKSFKGPFRLIRLCLLGIIAPSVLIALPLYFRYHVYGHQMYPLAVSDMRLIDNKVSTTWCQRQVISVNTTFNAFLLSKSPDLSNKVHPLTMVRHLILEDDSKEYWGFYMLKGSSVTVSTCARWPGASLIVIRGHKHLHECAYIGDDSSEELDEIMEAIKEGTYVPTSDNSPANAPDLMKRHREEVQFHHPIHANASNHQKLNNSVDTSDITDPIIMKFILKELREKTARLNKKQGDFIKAHSTVIEQEVKNVKIQPPKNSNRSESQEVLGEIMKKLNELGPSGADVLAKVNQKFSLNLITANITQAPLNVMQDMGRHYKKPSVNFDDNIDEARRRKRDLYLANQLIGEDEDNDLGAEEGFETVTDGIADHRGTINETTLNDRSNSEFWSSFSSSEEALLNCAGLILNLPLTPHHKCSKRLSETEAEETYLANTITYRVPVNGYYFFVFNSENEVQPNYIRVQFHLNKLKYDVSSAVANCTNSSNSCTLDLAFFSSEKVVMELPVGNNDSLWNEEFVVISECEPRTALYVICVIAVPVLVILFAFS